MGFIYNGINSKNMKIKARLTSWQASPALRNAYEVVPGRQGLLTLVVISQSGSLRLAVAYILKRALQI